MRISDWSSDVCSSDLCKARNGVERAAQFVDELADRIAGAAGILGRASIGCFVGLRAAGAAAIAAELPRRRLEPGQGRKAPFPGVSGRAFQDHPRSAEHTSELQSLMRISYAVFCLQKKNTSP